MARTKGGPNRSQAVRDYLSANPGASAKDVVTGLEQSGITVKEGLVYAVKGALKEKKKRQARVARAAKAATPSGNGKVDAVMMIREVKALAQKAGGFSQLRELVEALAE